MNQVFLIPFTNVPQQFEITLAGIDYIIIQRWNDAPDAGWVMDLLNAANNTPIACNIPFVVGVDLLDGLEYLGIPGQFIVYTTGNDFAVPTLDNLGIDSNVYFQTAVGS